MYRTYLYRLSAILLTLLCTTVSFSQEGEQPKGLFERSQSAYSNNEYARRINQSPEDLTLIKAIPFTSTNQRWSAEGEWNAELGLPIFQIGASYADNANTWLVSPSISIPQLGEGIELIKLKFKEWYMLESYHDKGQVAISEDNGQTWQVVSTRYGDGANWHETTIDISVYAGKQIKIGFHFTSDQNISGGGWKIEEPEILARTSGGLTTTITSLNAQAFPTIFMNVEVDTTGVGISSLTQSNFQVYENNQLQTGLFEVIPPTDTSTNNRLVDIIFLMDNSESMGTEQAAVANNVANFVADLDSRGVNYGLGLCRFGQSTDNGAPKVENRGELVFDESSFSSLWGLNIAFGATEQGFPALAKSASDFNFRQGARKVFIIIMNDDRPTQGGVSEATATQICLDQNITFFALTNRPQYFQAITASTNGAIFNVRSPFNEILDAISTQVSNNYLVRYRSSNPVFDATQREVVVQVDYHLNAARDTAYYVPGEVPRITRTPNTVALHEQAWPQLTAFDIEVEVVDLFTPFVQQALLYYKSDGTTNYQAVSMVQQSNTDIWRGTIPASVANGNSVDYYITATDGVTTASSPISNPSVRPWQLAITPNVAPSIQHTPITNAEKSVPIDINATVTDATQRLVRVSLFYRQVGNLIYTEAAMSNNSGSNYIAQIPGSVVDTMGVEYFIEAEDNYGTRNQYGTSDHPLLIEVEDAPYIFTPTSLSGGFLGIAQINGQPGTANDWIAAIDEQGNIAGANRLVMAGGISYINLQVYGDDPNTLLDEGISAGESFSLQLYDASEGVYYDYPNSSNIILFDQWANMNGAPMLAYRDFNRIFNFSCGTTAEAAFDYQVNRLSVTFTNESLAGDSFFWDFGDGTTSNDTSTTHVYSSAGTYTVCLISYGNCGNDTICENILVRNSPFNPNPTNLSGLLYGQIEISGIPASQGDWVGAFDEDGNCAGSAPVQVANNIAYLLLPVYGDDPNTLIDEGITGGENFYLQLYDSSTNEFLAYQSPNNIVPFTQWVNTNGSPMPAYNNLNEVYNFLIKTVDVLYLNANQNLISLDVHPEDSSVTSIFTSSIQDANVISISSQYDGVPVIFDPSLPQFLNTLTHMRKGYGYWVNLNRADTLVVEGDAIDSTYNINLLRGWNLIGYPPSKSKAPADHFNTLLRDNTLEMLTGFNQGSIFYDPNGPIFLNTLDSMRNGLGYWINVNRSVNSGTYRQSVPVHATSDRYMFIYGNINIPNISGEVEVLNERNEIIGKMKVLENGYLMTTPIHGDNPLTTDIEGMYEGERLSFRYGNQIIASTLTFKPDSRTHQVSLVFGLSNDLNIYPNPSYDQVRIAYAGKSDHPLEIIITDPQGRRIYTQKYTPKNTSGIVWNTRPYAAGIYLIEIYEENVVIGRQKLTILK